MALSRPPPCFLSPAAGAGVPGGGVAAFGAAAFASLSSCFKNAVNLSQSTLNCGSFTITPPMNTAMFALLSKVASNAVMTVGSLVFLPSGVPLFVGPSPALAGESLMMSPEAPAGLKSGLAAGFAGGLAAGLGVAAGLVGLSDSICLSSSPSVNGFPPVLWANAGEHTTAAAKKIGSRYLITFIWSQGCRIFRS